MSKRIFGNSGSDVPTGARPGYAELVAKLVDSSDEFRLLRRLRLAEGICTTDASPTRIGVALDVETTGLDPRRHRIIELALRRFRFDARGVITKLDRSYSWLEDPGEPLGNEIKALTGLDDGDLAGRAIDDALATRLIGSADLRVAHNSAFDRPFVDRRLPGCIGPWACSLRDVDWRGRGFDGGGWALGWLLCQAGFFHGAHRAADDVDALIALLRHGGDCTVLSELVATAERSTWRIGAVGAHFDVKDALKERGYRWEAEAKCWYREVSDEARQAEVDWLAENVYAPHCLPRLDGPDLREVTWIDRYA